MKRVSSAPTAGTRRVGRPPASEAWRVDDRILKAATTLFLARGFDGTSLEDVALAAKAGKASVYSRFPGKEALFVAVVKRSIDRTMSFDLALADEASVEQRLVAATTELLDRMLTQEVVSIMRVVIAETTRFPALADLIEELGRRRAIALLAGIIGDDPKQPTERADLLLSLVLFPLQFRALMGADIGSLRALIPAHVTSSVRLFCAGQGALRG
jgi:AcrR family transcriptional regulator